MEGEDTPVYTRRINAQESIVIAVAEAIATLENTKSLQIEPLYKSIDMEAVETLLHASDSHVTISFVYKDYLIEIVGGNRIEVYN